MRRVIFICTLISALAGWGTAVCLAQGTGGTASPGTGSTASPGTGSTASPGTSQRSGTTVNGQGNATIGRQGTIIGAGVGATNAPANQNALGQPGRETTIGQQGSTTIGQQGGTAIGQQGTTAVGRQGTTAIGQQGSTAVGQQGSTAIGQKGSIIGPGLGMSNRNRLALGSNSVSPFSTLGTNREGRFIVGTNGGRMLMGPELTRQYRLGTNRFGQVVIQGTNSAMGGTVGRQGTIIGTGVGGGTTNRP